MQDIKKSNVMKFREADHLLPASLSATEQDLLGLVLCEISKQQAINKLNGTQVALPNKFTYSENTMLDIFNCNKDKLRHTIEKAGLNLMKTPMSYSDKNKFYHLNLFAGVEYKRGGNFSIFMLDKTVEVISTYKGFSEMDFKLFVSLESKYQKRLFREINRWRTIKNKPMLLNDFKTLIGVDTESYPKFAAFRKNHIEPIFKAILEKTKGLWTATDAEGKGYKLFIKGGQAFTHIQICLKYEGKGQSVKNLTELDALLTYENIVNSKMVTIEQLNNLTKNIGLLLSENKIAILPNFHTLFLQAKENLEDSHS